MANKFLSFHRILVIGYGTIGRNICQALSTLKCDVTVYDIDPDILLLAKKDGKTIINDVNDIKFTENLIVIGVTGEVAFTSSMFFSFLTSDANKIYLASASSKRIEFQNIIDLFEIGDKNNDYKQIIDDLDNIQITQQDYGIIYSFCYRGINKKIILIANGYPVNFYRKDIISLTESVIDIVYCEIFMLLKYLLEEESQLKHKLYLLGDSKLTSLNVQEELLVRRWFELLSLQCDSASETIWNQFDVHPFEDLLREKYLLYDDGGYSK